MKKFLLSSAIVCLAVTVFAQQGNFRSRVSGNWDSPATWERDANSDGIFEESPSTVSPTHLDGTILVRNGHTVRVYTNVSIDQTTVESTGRIAINQTNVLTVLNGSGSDLVNLGRVSTVVAGNLVVSNGSVFEHAKNGGELPLATWQVGSFMLFTGIQTAVPTNLNQNFQNVDWNCVQSGNVNLAGALTQIGGDFRVLSTNGLLLNLATTSNTNITIGGGLLVQGNSRLSFSTSGAVTCSIGGNFIHTSSNISGSVLVSGSGNALIQLAGNLNVGISSIINLSSSLGSTVINIQGNLDNQGTITETSSGSGTITFDGTVPQNFVNAGVINNSVHYIINSNATVTAQGESAFTGQSLTVSGTLQLQSTNSTGALVLGTTTGNVRTTTRTFNSGADIVYSGASAQFVGNGHPVTNGVQMTVNNASGVTFNTGTSGNSGSQNLVIGGDLNLQNGNLLIASTGTPRNLSLGGIVIGTGSVSASGANVNLTFLGTGVIGNFPNINGQSFRSVTVNRPNGGVSFSQGCTFTSTTNVQSGTLELAGTTQLIGAVTLGALADLVFENTALSIGNNFTSADGGELHANASSSLTLTGGIVLSSPLNFAPTANTLGSLILNKTNGGTSIVVNQPLTITSLLDLQDGVLDIAGSALILSPSSTLRLSSIAGITNSSPAGGPWNLEYVLGSNQSSLEIPANGVLQNLTINTSTGTTVSLNQNIIVNGTFSIPNSNRSFNCANFDLTVMGGFINAGNFTAPSALSGTGLTINGDFSNTGSFNDNGGQFTLGGNVINNGVYNNFNTPTIIFSGITSFSGSTIPSFYHVVINGLLNAPSNLTVRGNFTNNGTLNAGTGTINFSGSSIQEISGSIPAVFNNINITNTTQPVSVLVSSDQQVEGLVSLVPNAVLDTDGLAGNINFTLLSSSAGTAAIGVLSNPIQMPGNVVVQRFIPAKDNDYRFISSPVTDASVFQLQDDFSVTGNFTGTSFPCSGCSSNGPSLRYYSESNKGAFNNGYAATPVSGGTNAEILVAGRGYSAYMWNAVSDFVIDLRGPLNIGSVAYTVKHTVSTPAEPTADGWNLLGNPFASTIQWDNGAGWVKSANIDPVVWVWDVASSTWRSFNADTQTGDLTDGLIASGQAFWVYVLPGVATLSVNEQAKSSQTASYYRKNNSTDFVRITVSNESSQDNVFLQSADTKPSFKHEIGIETISAGVLNDDGNKYAYFPVNNENDIQISIFTKTTGLHTISFENVTENNLLEGYSLLDKETNLFLPLTEDYKFISKTSNERASRFVLTKRIREHFDWERSSFEIYPNPANDELYLFDRSYALVKYEIMGSNGTILYTFDVTGTFSDTLKVNLEGYSKGIYYIRMLNKNGQIETKKLVKQ